MNRALSKHPLYRCRIWATPQVGYGGVVGPQYFAEPRVWLIRHVASQKRRPLFIIPAGGPVERRRSLLQHEHIASARSRDTSTRRTHRILQHARWGIPGGGAQNKQKCARGTSPSDVTRHVVEHGEIWQIHELIFWAVKLHEHVSFIVVE